MIIIIVLFAIILTSSFLINLFFFWSLGDPHRIRYAVKIERKKQTIYLTF